jgi:AraC-like DNA-binding protein
METLPLVERVRLFATERASCNEREIATACSPEPEQVVELTIKRLAFEPVLIKHLETLGIDHRSVTMEADFKKLDRQRRLYRLALFAKRMTGDELLGLRIAKKVPINAFGPLSSAIVSAPTPRHVLQTSVKHLRIFQSHPPNAAVLSTGRSSIFFEYKHPVRLRGFANFVPDLFYASTLQTLVHVGADLEGTRLELEYAPVDIASYRAEIGIPVTFKARRNRLIMPLDRIDAPLPGKFSSFSRAHSRLAENVLASISKEGLDDRVVEVLSLARDQTLRAPDVAAALNMSERSLRRKLLQRGLSFTALLAALRAELARAYLLEMPVRDVAELLGYCDASTFRRAFRRWTGSTPDGYLKEATAVGARRRRH